MLAMGSSSDPKGGKKLDQMSPQGFESLLDNFLIFIAQNLTHDLPFYDTLLDGRYIFISRVLQKQVF